MAFVCDQEGCGGPPLGGQFFHQEGFSTKCCKVYIGEHATFTRVMIIASDYTIVAIVKVSFKAFACLARGRGKRKKEE